MANFPADEQMVPAEKWAKFIQELLSAGDGHCSDVKELQKLCLRAHYDMEDLYAQLMTARDCLNEIKASAIEGCEAAAGALEDAP